MSDINLQLFCGEKTNTRMATPWGDGDYTYACNGHIIVRVPFVPGTEREPPVKNGISFTPTHDGSWQPLPAYAVPDLVQCPECNGTKYSMTCPDCDGEGVVFWDVGNHPYEADCKECCGTGNVPGGRDLCDVCNGTGTTYRGAHPGAMIGGSKISLYLLDKMRTLPDLEIYLPAEKPEGLVHFRFSGGDGAVMAMLKD